MHRLRLAVGLMAGAIVLGGRCIPADTATAATRSKATKTTKAGAACPILGGIRSLCAYPPAPPADAAGVAPNEPVAQGVELPLGWYSARVESASVFAGRDGRNLDVRLHLVNRSNDERERFGSTFALIAADGTEQRVGSWTAGEAPCSSSATATSVQGDRVRPGAGVSLHFCLHSSLTATEGAVLQIVSRDSTATRRWPTMRFGLGTGGSATGPALPAPIPVPPSAPGRSVASAAARGSAQEAGGIRTAVTGLARDRAPRLRRALESGLVDVAVALELSNRSAGSARIGRDYGVVWLHNTNGHVYRATECAPRSSPVSLERGQQATIEVCATMSPEAAATVDIVEVQGVGFGDNLFWQVSGS